MKLFSDLGNEFIKERDQYFESPELLSQIFRPLVTTRRGWDPLDDAGLSARIATLVAPVGTASAS